MTVTAGTTRNTTTGLRVRIADVPDPLGNVAVMVLDADGTDEYASVLPVETIIPERATYRATTPYGTVTVELPADGEQRQRAAWSQAAVDAYLAEIATP